ncbi:MAG: dioxygenase [Burkholderiaceae bacterium]|nr:dioxygenase [Burkholderiaceae bacterium]
MTVLPTLFLSHGSPMHAMQAGRAGERWTDLGRALPRPAAVLIASAHWETELPMLSTARELETIHDFGGFPDELYKIRYPALGAPAVAARAISLLDAAGLSATSNGCRGLDHGAWVPLRRMYPDADVPVIQLSIQPSLDAEHHLRVGAALAPLTREGVLIIGSGHLTHNLREWMAKARASAMAITEGDAVEPYVSEFRDWMAAALSTNDQAKLVRWRELAPHALRAHPTPEHLLPLYVAFGASAAGGKPRVEFIDAGTDHGVLAMDAYAFWPESRMVECS